MSTPSFDDDTTSDTQDSTYADVVGIFDSSFNQLIVAARPMRAHIDPKAVVMRHPVESGGVKADWRVILPIEIEVTVFLTGDEYRDAYQAVRAIFLGDDLVSVQTKTDTYFNQMLAAMPHEEDPDQFDIIAMQLRFSETIIIDAQIQALAPAQASPTDTSTANTGEKQPQTIAQSVYKYFSPPGTK